MTRGSDTHTLGEKLLMEDRDQKKRQIKHRGNGGSKRKQKETNE